MRRIVFLDRATVEAHLRAPSFPHEWVEHAFTAPDEVVERLAGADVAITNKVRIGARELDALPDLRLIAVAATGVDVIDLEACRARGVVVSNVRRYATRSVPEHALLLMLALSRSLVANARAVERGDWGRANSFCLLDHELHELFGATLGIVGWGSLGQATAALARALGMEILVAEHKGARAIREGRTAFDEVLRRSDVISLHAPLVPATRHLIGQAELDLMKRTAILVNTARGGLVDERALVEHLRAGKLRGAGFDVLETEPPVSGSPLLELAGAPNVLVTPHVAWASRETMQRLADQLVANIEAWHAGHPTNVV